MREDVYKTVIVLIGRKKERRRKGRKKVDNCMARIFNLREGFTLQDDNLPEVSIRISKAVP